MRAWKGREGFEGRSGEKTWVYRITLNAAREHWRKRGRYKAALARFAAEPRAEAAEPAAGSGLDKALARALAQLSQEQREAVTLVYLEGLSLAEAAEVSAAPLGTVKSRLHQARQLLATALRNTERKAP